MRWLVALAVELSEAAARELGSYVVEDSGPMRRYRRFSDGALDSLVYAGWEAPSEPLVDISRGNGACRPRFTLQGELLSYTVYHYNDHNELEELITHAPDGTVTSREEA